MLVHDWLVEFGTLGKNIIFKMTKSVVLSSAATDGYNTECPDSTDRTRTVCLFTPQPAKSLLKPLQSLPCSETKVLGIPVGTEVFVMGWSTLALCSMARAS